MPEPGYDVILVDVDPAKKSKLMMALLQAAPYPHLSRENAAMIVVNLPSVVVSCLPLKQAVLLELLIELAGGTVEIYPAKTCD